MKYNDAVAEYMEGIRKLPTIDDAENTVCLGSYSQGGRVEGEIQFSQIELALCHFRDTLIMAGCGRYRTLEM